MAEGILDEYGLPEDLEPEDIKAAVLAQVLRFTAGVSTSSTRRSLDTKAVDVERIRSEGFDVIWERRPRGSLLVWGAENLTVNSIRDLLSIVRPIPTLDDIKKAIQDHRSRTGTRLVVSYFPAMTGFMS